MKKTLILVLSLVMVFALCGCGGKSENMIAAEEAIDAAIEAAIFSEEDGAKVGALLIAAEEAYDNLTEKEKEKFDDAYTDGLEKYREEYIEEQTERAYELLEKTSTTTIDGMYDVYATWYFAINELLQLYSD